MITDEGTFRRTVVDAEGLTSSNLSSDLATKAMLAPCFANVTAMASPMPLLAPVTRTHLPASSAPLDSFMNDIESKKSSPTNLQVKRYRTVVPDLMAVRERPAGTKCTVCLLMLQQYSERCPLELIHAE